MVEEQCTLNSGRWWENESKVEKVNHPWSRPGIGDRLEAGSLCFSSQNCKDGSCSTGRSWAVRTCLWHHSSYSIPYSPTPGNLLWILWWCWQYPHYVASVFVQLYQSLPGLAGLGAWRGYPSPFWNTQCSGCGTHRISSSLPWGLHRTHGQWEGLG